LSRVSSALEGNATTGGVKKRILLLLLPMATMTKNSGALRVSDKGELGFGWRQSEDAGSAAAL
jgi:hypothetical protein